METTMKEPARPILLFPALEEAQAMIAASRSREAALCDAIRRLKAVWEAEGPKLKAGLP